MCILLIVFVADLIGYFSLFEYGFCDGGIIAMGGIVAAEGGEFATFSPPRYD
jgi:hypothetical protein